MTPSRPRPDPLRDLDSWLERFAVVAADGGDAPASVQRSRRLLENMIVEQAQGKVGFLDLLMALGEAEKALNQSLGYLYDTKTKSFKINPIPYLRSSRWLVESYEDSAEFRLALALAARLNLRQRLVQVRGHKAYWERDDDKTTTWKLGSLEENLLGLTQRIEIEEEQAEKSGARVDAPMEDLDKEEEQPKESSRNMTLNYLPNFKDLEDWVRGDVDDDRLESMARGLSLLKFTRSLEPVSAEFNTLPIEYQLLKVVQHRQIKPDLRLPRVPGLINKLRANRKKKAVEDAERRLRSSSLRPKAMADWLDPNFEPSRLGAALAFPITDQQVATLLKQVCISEEY